MRILMVTWEYPPFKVGGIAPHCFEISKALVRLGHDVHILTAGNEEKEEYDAGITIHRIPSAKAPDTITWATYIAHKFEKTAIRLHKINKFDVVHAHDWMMVPAGVGIKKVLKIPMVFTLHSLEHGRSGVHDAYTKMINDLEWYGTYEASEVITVGRDFSQEVKRLFSVPDEKIHYIPNGVDISKFDKSKIVIDRDDYVADWEKLVLFVGRLTHQKGIEYLIHAAPKILSEHPEAKFVIVGGGAIDYYRNMAMQVGLREKIYFTGYVSDETVISLFKTADVTVIPSVYEPFGIVALEAAAARKPAVGSYTGGLKETIIHEHTGLHTLPANPNSIADQMNRILWDDNWGKYLGRNGREMVEQNYRWEKIAKWTTGVYGKALGLW
jgi:glycosyltransferase involved in cell wall biosynthesis